MPRYQIRVTNAKEEVEKRFPVFIRDYDVAVIESSAMPTYLTFYSEDLNEDEIRERLSGLEILSVKEANWFLCKVNF